MIVHHVEYGTGKPVVFLGSIASSVDMWLPQLDALSADRRVIALDYRGHGLSGDADVQPGETSIDDLAQDVLETLDTLGVDKFTVVGLSMGGAVAQYLAATSPRVTQAAFLCTGASFGGPKKWHDRAELTRSEGMSPMLDGVIGLWVTEEFMAARPATTDFYRRMILSTRGSGYAFGADALAHWDFTDRLPEITVPVLTIAGEEDASTPPATVHAIAEGVSGPATSVTVSPGAHVPTIEAADQINAALSEFLDA